LRNIMGAAGVEDASHPRRAVLHKLDEILTIAAP
jgi:hypothetical protein